MGQEQFAAIMPYISADLVGMIVKKKSMLKVHLLKTVRNQATLSHNNKHNVILKVSQRV